MEIESLEEELERAQASIHTQAFIIKDGRDCEERLGHELEEARSQLATMAADREDLAQLKKQVKEDAAELHREENCMKLEKVRWQRELSDARDELADAKATMLKQANKIRELERGYSLKPNPAESRLRLEIGNLREELEAYKQQQPTIDLPERVAEIVNFLKELLPPDTKWPKRVMPSLRKFLESKEEENNEPD